MSGGGDVAVLAGGFFGVLDGLGVKVGRGVLVSLGVFVGLGVLVAGTGVFDGWTTWVAVGAGTEVDVG